MRALLYLTKRSMINNLKKAVKKPLTLLVVLACAAYAVFLAVMLAELAVQMKFDSAKGMVIILTVWSLYLFLLNFMSYASRKGILFRPAHAHFIFNAPVDPKVVNTQRQDVFRQWCLLQNHHSTYRIWFSIHCFVFRKIYIEPTTDPVLNSRKLRLNLKPHV